MASISYIITTLPLLWSTFLQSLYLFRYQRNVVSGFLVIYYQDLTTCMIYFVQSLYLLCYKRDVVNDFLFIYYQDLTTLWSSFNNPSIYCALHGMLFMASNSYIITTLPLLWSIFKSLYLLRYQKDVVSGFLVIYYQDLTTCMIYFVQSLYLLCYKRDVVNDFLFIYYQDLTTLWSSFNNPSIYCALHGMLFMASNSYIITTPPLLWSIFKSLYLLRYQRDVVSGF